MAQTQIKKKHGGFEAITIGRDSGLVIVEVAMRAPLRCTAKEARHLAALLLEAADDVEMAELGNASTPDHMNVSSRIHVTRELPPLKAEWKTVESKDAL